MQQIGVREQRDFTVPERGDLLVALRVFPVNVDGMQPDAATRRDELL
jgi:hypothetical protein